MFAINTGKEVMHMVKMVLDWLLDGTEEYWGPLAVAMLLQWRGPIEF